MDLFFHKDKMKQNRITRRTELKKLERNICCSRRRNITIFLLLIYSQCKCVQALTGYLISCMKT